VPPGSPNTRRSVVFDIYSKVITSRVLQLSALIRFFDTVASNIRWSKETFILYYPAINKVARQRYSAKKVLGGRKRTSQLREPELGAQLRRKRVHRVFLESRPRSANDVARRQPGTKMAAANRFGFRFSLANAGRPASGWGQKAKTLAKICAIRLDRIQPDERIYSCGIASRAETIMSRRICVSLLSSSGRGQYCYCSISAERRHSENCWSNCGNPVPSISTDFRIPLKNKHLDLFQNGPRLANRLVPARVLMYWCPETKRTVDFGWRGKRWSR
jgi:hypothetical protein